LQSQISGTFKLFYLCCKSTKELEMANGKSAFNYLVLSAILIVLVFSCTEKKMITGSGVLKGKISIGPLCPVQKDPPDPGCLPTKETFLSWATAVWTMGKKTKIAQLNPNLDGIYRVELPAGDYILDFEVTRTNGVGGSNLPSPVSISRLDTTIFNINIDTGIR
jgi:hypothetical protein